MFIEPTLDFIIEKPNMWNSLAKSKNYSSSGIKEFSIILNKFEANYNEKDEVVYRKKEVIQSTILF